MSTARPVRPADTRPGTTEPVSPAPGLGRPAAMAVVAAAVAAAAVHLLFDAAGADFLVAPGGSEPSTVTAPMAAGVAALATALGGAFAVGLARVTARPSRAFLLATVVVLVLMAANPVLAADQALTVVALEVEHLVVAAVALWFLLPPLRARDRA